MLINVNNHLFESVCSSISIPTHWMVIAKTSVHMRSSIFCLAQHLLPMRLPHVRLGLFARFARSMWWAVDRS